LAALLIAGCGGGGGGSGGDTNNGSSAVTVGTPTPAKITATKIVGDSLGIIKFTGNVTGNIDSLQGKPIAVVVEDPAQLFMGTGQLTLVRTASGAAYELSLAGRPLSTGGHLTGTIRIFACLDATCQQTLGGTPLTVPYDLNVEDLTLSRQQINLTVPFGTVPAVETVNVSWPSQVEGWLGGTSSMFPGNLLNGYGTWSTDHQLRIEMMPVQPGTYIGTVNVKSFATLADNRRVDFEKSVTVNYTVTPNPDVDYVVWPAATIQLTQSASDPLVHRAYYILVPNTGVSVLFLGVDYLSGAGTRGPATSWWDESFREYHTCVNYTDCLAPGLYTAQARYRIVSPKGSRDIAIPVNLTVTP
jgi:hypothetical protein